MKNSSTLIKLLVASILLTLTAACSSDKPDDKTVYTRITEGSLRPGSEIPVPTDDVIVTITGSIGASNVDNTIQMDTETVESVGVVEYTVDDPFENKRIVYRGVLMSDLLNLWEVDEDATTLHVVALNDYSVDVPIADLREYPVILALQADGEYMPISTRGPAMLVYPYNDFEFDIAIYNDYWIWQIASIEVR